MLLEISSERLDIVEHDHMFRAEPCCNMMLEKWLKIDTTTSWKKLFAVIESFSLSHQGT